MKIKRLFLSVCTLVMMGFIPAEPCKSDTSVQMVLVNENVPSSSETDPEVHIPDQSPAEKAVSAELPEPPAQDLSASEASSVQISSPPTAPPKSDPPLPVIPEPALAVETLDPSVSPPVLPEASTVPSTAELSLPEPSLAPAPAGSFSVMTKRPVNPVPPASVITIRPGEPPSPVSATSGSTPNAQGVSPPASPPAVITAKPAPPRSDAVQAQKPVPPSPDPSKFIKPAEPDVPVPPVRQPLVLPVNPLPEVPARTPPSIMEPKEEKVAYSRTVKAMVGQMVEIPFRGSGWVYLGEQKTRQGISYDSRRLEKEGQTFIFRAETAGTYTLTFYKQDFIEDYILNDYVQVIVGEYAGAADTNRSQPADRGRVLAEPRWPVLPEAPESVPSSATIASAGTANPPAAPTSAVAPPANSVPPVPSVDYLQQAKEAYAAGSFPQAISLLDQFREQYPGGSDEAWWLYGQSFEANSPSRDIRSAVDYYRRLIREYPQSPHGTDAQRRISYLERYYFTIQ